MVLAVSDYVSRPMGYGVPFLIEKNNSTPPKASIMESLKKEYEITLVKYQTLGQLFARPPRTITIFPFEACNVVALSQTTSSLSSENV
jgi:hypothetical protein